MILTIIITIIIIIIYSICIRIYIYIYISYQISTLAFVNSVTELEVVRTPVASEEPMPAFVTATSYEADKSCNRFPKNMALAQYFTPKMAMLVAVMAWSWTVLVSKRKCDSCGTAFVN